MLVEHTVDGGGVVRESMTSDRILAQLRAGQRVTVIRELHGFDTRGHYALVYLSTGPDALPMVYPPHNHVPTAVARRAEAVVLCSANGFLYVVREPRPEPFEAEDDNAD